VPDHAKSDDPQAPTQHHAAASTRVLAALLGVALAASGVLWGVQVERSGQLLGQDGSTADRARTSDPAGDRDALASQALDRQGSALTRGSQASYLAVWDSTTVRAQQRGAATYRNLRALGVTALDTRYVAPDEGLSSVEQRQLGGVAWKAGVEVSYAIDGDDSAPVLMTVSYTFVHRGDQVYIVDVQPATGERAPVWLLPRLTVRTSERTLVAAVSPAAAARVDRHLRRAVSEVQAVLPSWRGSLVAYVPATTAQVESVLAATPGSYDNIAAVTTSVDGSVHPRAPVAIVVNTAVFHRLGPVGSRVVVSHESTHAATNAAVIGMPLWVAEGFADYVGVGAVDVPPSVAARVAIRDVRRNAAPRALPSNEDFSASSQDLELAYEQSWLANRLIAATYGQRDLVAFYRSVVADPDDMAGAFRELGTTEEAFTTDWRRSLEVLAARR